jgi:nucleoid DNA-binding protein
MPRKPTSVKTPYTKAQVISEISENSGLSKKQVSTVFDELSDIMQRHIRKRGCGEFTVPGLFKVKTQKKPARRARKGINPFTGEETMFKARPASVAVKVRPLKKVKDMATA